jgi:outer membrane receptor protein involved in Fe transport
MNFRPLCRAAACRQAVAIIACATRRPGDERRPYKLLHVLPPNKPMNSKLLTPLLLSALFAVPLTASAADSPRSEEVVVLPEFTATATSARNDYIAAEAISGTRTGAKLVETPYSVQVLTSEFMNDFQLFDMADQLRFVAGAFSGAEDTGANNGKTLRGFTPPVLRDGFSRANPPDRSTVDRVEIIRGPVSTLYGQSSPGGLINYVSRRPKRTPHYSATGTIGAEYDYKRWAFDATGPIVKDKLFYFADYAHNYTESDEQYYYNRKDLYSVGLTYLPSPKTSITATWERQIIRSNQGDTIPVYRVGSFTAGIFWDLATFNVMGPHNKLMRDFESGNVLIEHRFTSNLIARLNLQSYDKDFEEEQYRFGSGITVQPGGTMTGEPFYQNQDESAYLAQTDILWRVPGDKVSHAFLIAADFSNIALRNTTYVAPPVRTSATVNRRPTFVINPWAPVWVYTPKSAVNQVFQDTDREIRSTGAFASHRMFLLDNRLITLVGGRYDRVAPRKLRSLAATRTVSANDQTPIVDISDGSGSSDDAFSYTLGLNYKVRGDSLVWFANHSTGFEPTVSIDNGTHAVVPNERSSGIETGFKGTLLDDALSWTASIFKIKKTDVAVANPDYDATASNPVAQFITTGSEEAKGYELDARWSVNRSFYVQAGGSFVDARVTEPVAQRDRLPKAPRYVGYAVTRYAFDQGALKGLRIGASMSYTSDYLYNRGSATRFRQIHPAVVLYNGFISYGFRTGEHRKLSHTIALNGLNLFDKYYLQDTFRLARGREVRLSYTVGY